MEKLLKKEREFVTPGDEIVKSINYLPGKNCYRDGDSIYAKTIGLISVSGHVISVIPLNKVYMPKADDLIIGKIIDIQPNGWVVDINAPYEAFLPLSGVKEFIDISKVDLSKYYAINDLIYAKVLMVNKKLGLIYISMKDPKSYKIKNGKIIKINPAKIPRVIGKSGSMINMIKTKTGSKISIGQNGFIWIYGGDMDLTIKAFKIIEEKSWSEGLTDYISKILDEEMKNGNGKETQ